MRRSAHIEFTNSSNKITEMDMNESSISRRYQLHQNKSKTNFDKLMMSSKFL